MTALVEALEAALEPHARADGMTRQAGGAAGVLVWEKVGEYARAGERDRIEVRVAAAGGGGARVTGEVTSYMRDTHEPLGAFGIAQRHGPGVGATTDAWWVADDSDVARVVAEIEALVAGQVIPWLDEPVPLVAPGAELPTLGPGGLGGLVLPQARRGPKRGD